MSSLNLLPNESMEQKTQEAPETVSMAMQLNSRRIRYTALVENRRTPTRRSLLAAAFFQLRSDR